MKSVRPLRQVAGWAIVVALVYAPLAFGSIPPPALNRLEELLALAAFFWGLDLLVSRQRPRLPWPVLLAGGWLLLQGWFMAWNAHGAFLWPQGAISSVSPPLPAWPGAMERGVAIEAMLRVSALIATLLAAVDLASETVWRLRLLWTMAGTGALFSVFGLAQQAGLVRFVAVQMNQYEGVFFSTYNYHANAGAYLNVVIPAIATLLFLALRERQQWGRLALLCLFLLCTLTAALVNTSRGAQAITALLLLGLGGWAGVRLARGGGRRAKMARQALLVACVGCVVLGIVLAPHLHRVVQKWEQLPQVLTGDSGRMQVWPIAASMARSAGPLGHGPGAFKMMLPRSPMLTNAFYSRWIIHYPAPWTAVSMWSQAHEDYLQTLVEFGWLGGAAAGVLLFGGILRAWQTARRNHARLSTFVAVGSLAALLAVALHSTFDFPLQVASLQLYVAIYLALAWAMPVADAAPVPTELEAEMAAHRR